MVDALLAAGADATVANRYHMTPLLLATTNGDAALVERLVKARADVNLAGPGVVLVNQDYESKSLSSTAAFNTRTGLRPVGQPGAAVPTQPGYVAPDAIC